MSAFFSRCKFVLRYTLSFIVLLLCTLVVSLAALLTLFRARRWYAERIVAPVGRLILTIWGIRLEVHGDLDPIPGQKIYISNHSSTIDIFTLVALRLPNTRFFLSAFLRKFPPIGIIGTIVGTVWIVTQKRPAERVEIFKQAEAMLRRTGDSIYLSPEGKRVTTGDIGAFNKGSFHLATLLGAPIVPMFIHIPREINPGTGLDAGSGTVHVYFDEPIDTSTWILADLLENKERVRDHYVAWHRHIFNE